MLDVTDFNQPDLTKEEYKQQYKPLIERLVTLQQIARSKGVGLVVVFEGFSGAGKGGRISDLMYNLDARATHVHSADSIDYDFIDKLARMGNDVIDRYPILKQYWDKLGERGCMTIFSKSWYSTGLEIMSQKFFGEQNLLLTKNEERRAVTKMTKPLLESCASFEKMLVDDGYILVKFFMNIRQTTQMERFTKLYMDPKTRWRVPPAKMCEAVEYEDRKAMFEQALQKTNYDFAPWIVLNGENKRESNLTIVKTLVNKLTDGITLMDARDTTNASFNNTEIVSAPEKSAFEIVKNYPTLSKVDYSLKLPRENYRQELKALQKRFSELQITAFRRRIPLIIMYEGWDAAGKGGNIKRLAQALDARSYTIYPSPSPTPTELAHPFLWRYWTRLPEAGRIGIYDRSWYGRVLVERVEGFAKPAEWQRAYDEINRFEKDLVDWGAVVVKFWVEIDQDEQLERFRLRAQNPEKAWKLTDEDWRNREKYPAYREAIEDAFRLTSTTYAPWTILESNDKPYARVKALKTIIAALEKRLGEK